MANINELKSAIGVGASANKFKIVFGVPAANPGLDVNSRNGSVLAKATSFPSKTIGQTEVFKHGKKLPLPGDVEFENTWDVTFHNTQDHDIRKIFLQWQKEMDDFKTGNHTGNPEDYMVSSQVIQLGAVVTEETANYIFENMFPQVVGPIEVADENQNQIQEFVVTFSFSDFD